uniref:Apoptosis-stimulating of p53 protein 1 n=1 Tax=Timema cristinae TaxID=61476 RepID=A0A7R9H093_TIMCR|nr:unnamed protein product [Timema cristinae]
MIKSAHQICGQHTTSDLDSIRALFNEKEKELSVAVAKVEELTQQLEVLRRGRGGTREQQPPHQSPAALELDKLRRELMYRNKLNEQQNARLSQQREVLSQKQEEMSNIDKRISELQDRLHRKRLLNTQLTNQINATSLKSSIAASGQQPPLRSAASATTIQQQQHPAYSHQQPTKSGKLLRPMTTGNIAAIEPYHHVPVSDCEKHRHHLQDDKMILSQDDFHTKLIGSGNNAGIHNGNLSNKSKDKDEQFLPEFAGSKSDPKYQTLPYNTKFTVNFVSTAGTKVGADKQDLDGDTRRNSDAFETTKNNNNNLNTINNNNHLNYPSQQQQQHLMTVHSIPLPTLTEVSKGLATPLSQHHGEQSAYQQQLASKAHGMGHLGPREVVGGYKKEWIDVSNLVAGTLPCPQKCERSHRGRSAIWSPGHTINMRQQQDVAASIPGLDSCGFYSWGMPFGSTHSTYIQPGLTRGQPVGGSSSSTSSTSSLATNSSSGSSVGHQVAATPTITVHATSTTRTVRPLGYGVVLPPTPLTLANQKPVSSVAPTTVQHQKPSPIYQTSSTKIHPVQPHILSSTPQGILKDLRGELSPPQSSSTPLNTPESYTSQESRVGKPALPPKPAVPVKPTPPPRQTQHGSEENRLGHSYPDPYSQHLSKPGSHQQVLFSGSSIPSSEHEDPPPLPASDPPDEATLGSQRRTGGVGGNCDPLPIIKARPLTIKKQPASEQPRLKTGSGGAPSNVHVSINRRIEMPPAFFFPESEAPPADLVSSSEQSTFSSTQSGSSQTSVETSSSVSNDEVDRATHDPTNEELENNNVRTPALGEECNRTDKGEEDKPQTLNNINSNQEHSGDTGMQHIVRRGTKKGNLKAGGGKEPGMGSRRVSFDPLALLLDASLEGELELVRKTASQVANPSAANDEGITALHNAICAGHLDIVMFLVEFGCDVNAQDSDGWTPLHCAASCNNLSMVRFLVEHGACIFATTLSDHETAAEKCEEDEEGFDGCSEYLYTHYGQNHESRPCQQNHHHLKKNHLKKNHLLQNLHNCHRYLL